MPYSSARLGILCAFGAFASWGVFPLYFRLLDQFGAIDILGHRIVWSLAACSLFVVAARQWRTVAAVLRRGRTVALLALAAAFVAGNWGVYIYAVNSGQVVEASLGYFINPLISVVLGVVVLRERLRRAQWAAVAIGAVAVAVLTYGYGHAPIIAIILAGSFAVYGLLKNRVGRDIDALTGLTIETLVLAPFAAGLLVYLGTREASSVVGLGTGEVLLLASTGFVTVVPLLFFAGATRRIPLSTVGLMQYITPSLQLMCGLVFLGEHMPLVRWLGFGLVWVALAVLTFDGLRTAHRRRSEVAPIEASAA